MAFTNSVIAPPKELTVEWLTTNDYLVGAVYNDLKFKVVDQNGDLVTGVTLKSVKFKATPYRDNVIGPYSNNIKVLQAPGEYAVAITPGHISGNFTVSMVLVDEGIEYTIPDKVFTGPGTEGKFSINPNTLSSTDGPTEVEITGTQDRASAPNSPLVGTFTSLSFSGGMVAEQPNIVTLDAQGKGKITLTPNGKVEDIKITGIFVSEPSKQQLAIDQTVTIEKGALKPSVTAKRSDDDQLKPNIENNLYFDLIDQDGNPVVGATFVAKVGGPEVKYNTENNITVKVYRNMSDENPPVQLTGKLKTYAYNGFSGIGQGSSERDDLSSWSIMCRGGDGNKGTAYISLDFEEKGGKKYSSLAIHLIKV